MNRIKVLLGVICFIFVVSVSAKDYAALLSWPDRQLMAFPVTGVVDEVFVHTGQQVKQGQKLARLDLVPFEIQIKTIQAKIDRITPLLFDAQRDFDQAQELFERTVLSEVELQKIESILKGLKADNDQLKAELDMANWQYAHGTLNAPVAGRIIKQMLHNGLVISGENMSESMIELVSNKLMHVAFSVDAEQVGGFKIGQKAVVEVASEQYPAIVKSITSDAREQYQINLEFISKADDLYYAGQKAKVIF